MTTDSVSKQVVVEGAGWKVGGMAKGAGMLAPQLATMLVVLTTDAVGPRRRPRHRASGRDPGQLRPPRLRRLHVHQRHRHGAWPAAPAGSPRPLEDFTAALTQACTDLAMQLLKDAEGADHEIAITVVNAATEDDAVEVGRQRGAQQPVQGRRLRQRPQLGPGARQHRHHRRGVRPGRPRRRHERRLGLPAVRPRPPTPPPSTSSRARSASPSTSRRAPSEPPSGPTTSPTPTSTRTAPTPHEPYRHEIEHIEHDPSKPDPAKARTLAAALPWLKRYHGKIVVVKYGGNAMTDDTLKQAFAEDIAFLRFAGFKPVVVHGGGPQISPMLDKLGIESEFRGGLRVTTPEAMDVVRMVLVGQVQRELVGLINEHGPLAVGCSGEDAGLFTAEPTNTVVDGEEVDLGLVGEVAKVRPESVLDLIEAGRIPVVSSVAPDERRPGAQRERRLRRRLARRRPGRREAARAHRRRGALPRLAEQRRRDRRDQPRGARRDPADARLGHGARRWAPASRPSRTASRGPPWSTAASRTPYSSSCSPTRASAPRCCPASRPRPGRQGTHRHERPPQQRYAGALMNTFGPPKLVLARGEGAHVWDDDGKEYVDLLGGIAVNALGHAHPALVEAVTGQLGTLGHISNFFTSAPAGRARRAAARAPRRGRARCSSPTPAPRPTRRPSS